MPKKYTSVTISRDARKVLGESKQLIAELASRKECWGGGEFLSTSAVLELSIRHYNDELKRKGDGRSPQDTEKICQRFVKQVLSSLGLVLNVNDDGQVDVFVDPEKISVVLELLSGSSINPEDEKTEKGRPDVDQSPRGVSQNQQP